MAFSKCKHNIEILLFLSFLHIISTERAKALTCAGKDYNISSTLIWLDDVACQGNETSLVNCVHSTKHNCIPREAAGVNCDSEGATYIILLYRCI